MPDLLIHAPHVQKTTSIPNVFFDTYMLRANGEFLKVYLYLYRWCCDDTAHISIASIADTLALTESDVLRALRYWQDEGLVRFFANNQGEVDQLELLPIGEQKAIRPTPSMPAAQPVQAAAQSAEDYTKPAYSMQQIQQFSQENNGEELFLVIQQYIGRPLNQTDMNTILFFHEKLGFSTELIEYLVEYCVAADHKSFHYMEKVAINWAQEGIDTVSKAKGRQPRYSRTYYDVLKAFGIQGRGPAPAEAEYIRRWIDEYGFSSSLILEACNRTITQIHQPSFNYADKILSGWLEKKVTTQDQLRQLDSAREKKAKSNKVPAPSPNKSASNRFHNFNQRSYNYSDLEQKLVQKRRISSEH